MKLKVGRMERERERCSYGVGVKETEKRKEGWKREERIDGEGDGKMTERYRRRETGWRQRKGGGN